MLRGEGWVQRWIRTLTLRPQTTPFPTTVSPVCCQHVHATGLLIIPNSASPLGQTSWNIIVSHLEIWKFMERASDPKAFAWYLLRLRFRGHLMLSLMETQHIWSSSAQSHVAAPVRQVQWCCWLGRKRCIFALVLFRHMYVHVWAHTEGRGRREN